MQQRETWTPRTAIEALLARSDASAHEYIADLLLSDRPVEARTAPEPAAAREIDYDAAEAG
jgi:hypothetical protein